ncbi:MAG: MMPL family transporter, partial [Verrucomicrobiota bacterium]
EISSGMERDIKVSGLTTISVIALIFWVWYRRFRPLCWLVAMLGLIFLITLGIAGLLIRDLTVMNVGFASILIGLSVDYGILIYQATLRSPGSSAAVRRESQRGICWAAATTAAAFGSLMASSLPGVSELGVLVGLGIAAGAVVMLTVYCSRLSKLSANWQTTGDDEPVSHPERLLFGPISTRFLGIVTLGFVIACGVFLITEGMPEVDFSDRATRPRVSEAYDALDDIKSRLMNGENNGYVVVTGTGEQVRGRLIELASSLEQAESEGTIIRHTLPTNFVPIAAFQRENLEQAVQLILSQERRLKRELDEAGFSDDAVLAFNAILRQWEKWLESDTLIFPQSDVADRMLHRFVKVVSPDEIMAAGMVVANLDADLRWLQTDDTQLADWTQTMLALRVHIPGEILRILAVLGVIVVVMLGFTFGRIVEILWVAITIGLSLVAMLGSMAMLGLSWNFFNLAAVLLTLGAGLDYSIHMLLGFRRHGDVLRVQRDVGQALLVCGLSTVAGFGSLAWASNLGLASLGRVCALSLFLNALVAIFLLPLLWNWVHARK